MKSKKPFLIFCAAAVTLALVLPFMGVFAFAEDESVSFTLVNTTSRNVNIYINSWNNYVTYMSGGSSYSISRADEDLAIRADQYNSGSWYCRIYLDSSGTSLVSSDSSNPSILAPDDVLYILDSGSSSPLTFYVRLVTPVPPDPLAPVSDGMDTMISVFGDVIDYIINTPDVAIFVAISVASCAIIPMGIILIKKLIKGY